MATNIPIIQDYSSTVIYGHELSSYENKDRESSKSQQGYIG